MEIKEISTKILDFIKKYRYAVLVLVIGMVLMNIPTGRSQKSTGKKIESTQPSPESAEDRLTQILHQIEGVGEVEVMLTEASGSENIYQTDEDLSGTSPNLPEKTQTVILKDSDRNEIPLIRKTISAKYLGAIVVCQGADDPAVRLALVDAVCKITGLGSDCVSIVKMK